MDIKSNIKLECKDSKCSKILYKSLEVDNEDFVEGSLDENIINFKIESEKLGSFLATADDLIASLILAETIIKNTNKEDIWNCLNIKNMKKLFLKDKFNNN